MVQRPRARAKRKPVEANRNVFINCPFDGGYKDLFDAIVFTIFRSGFRARCALETDDASQNRFDKICSIIGQCRFGVHDISRTETSGRPPVPRFNMPLELGLFLGARRFGQGGDAQKVAIIFDREPYRYQKFISDIAGQDIHAHGGDVEILIRELASWLRQQSQDVFVPGGQAIAAEYARFKKALPGILRRRRLRSSEANFFDLCFIVAEYVKTL